MGRRAAGFALVMVVLVVALTVPALPGVRIAGSPIAVVVAPVPDVGDCLRRTQSDPTIAAAVPGIERVAPLLTVNCGLPHDAQVISLAQNPDHFPMTKGAGGARYPDLSACGDAAYPFLGVRALNEAGDRSDLLGPWSPASMGSFLFLSPDPMQLRIGQRWL